MINKLNFYQLDNLINNRVPFMFYNMTESLVSWYSSVNRMHLETYEARLAYEQIINDLTIKKVPKDYAVVLLCHDGTTSLELYKQLDSLSYTNVYVVDGGYQQIVTEREQI